MALVADITSAANICPMARTESRKAKIEPIHREEAAALKRLYDAKTDGLSQAAFAAEYDLGSQGNLWQYLNAHSPLNAHAASKFAAALGVQVRDFSPRLADEIEGLASGQGPAPTPGSRPWPFRRLSEKKIRALNQKDFLLLESAFMDAALDAGLDVLIPMTPKRVVDPGRAKKKTA